MNPRGLAGSAVLIFSDVSLALAVWGTAILIRASWGTSTIAGVLPVAVWVALRAAVGLYPGYGIDAPDELRRQGYATLGALAIACAFLGLHRGQDVSRSVLIGGFLALLIAAPLARGLAKRGLRRAGLWGAG